MVKEKSINQSLGRSVGQSVSQSFIKGQIVGNSLIPAEACTLAEGYQNIQILSKEGLTLLNSLALKVD